MAEIEWHVSETIINGIELMTVHECLEVVLHDWALGSGSMLGSCNITLDAVTKCENVLKSFVLESVWVDIDHA